MRADDIFEGGNPSEDDLKRRRMWSTHPDPILAYVGWESAEDDYQYECGPTGLQRYRALRSEMERANALSDVRTCEVCLSECIPHTEVVCIHALMGQTPAQRSFFEPVCSGCSAPPPNAGLAPRALAICPASTSVAPRSPLLPHLAGISSPPSPPPPPPPFPLVRLSPAVRSP